MKITANGISIHYQLEGPASGPVVTLSHSLATNLSMWDPQLPALASRYRVLRYDTRGHGATDAPEGPYSLEQLAEDARGLLQALGIARTHFIGLSMGGFIGQILALTYPQMLHSLVLCDTTSRIPPEAKAMESSGGFGNGSNLLRHGGGAGGDRGRDWRIRGARTADSGCARDARRL